MISVEAVQSKRSELEKDLTESRQQLDLLVQKVNMLQGGLLTIDDLLKASTNGGAR